VSYFTDLGYELPPMENPADWLLDVVSGEVVNAKEPGLMREVLFEKWAQTGGASQGISAKPLSLHDANKMDQSIVLHMIEEEWSKIDLDGNGVLDATELQRLIEDCTMQRLELDIAREFIAAASKFGKPVDSCSFSVASSFSLSSYETFDDEPEEKVLGDLSITQQQLHDFILGALRMVDGEVAAEQDKVAVQQQQESAQHRLLPGPQLSEGGLARTTPGHTRQFRILLHRGLVQFWRNWRRRVLDLAMVCVCAIAIALMHKGKTGQPSFILLFHLGLSLLIVMSSLRVFADRPVFWRERSSGISIAAFFQASVTVSGMDAAFQTVAYVSVYYLITAPPGDFTMYLVPCVMASWVCCGWGYFLSALLPHANATMASVGIMLLLSGVLADPGLVKSALTTHSFSEVLVFFSHSRWTTQMAFISHIEYEGGLQPPNITDCSAKLETTEEARQFFTSKVMGFGKYQFFKALMESYLQDFLTQRLGYWNAAIVVLIFLGVLLRIGAYLSLRFMNTDKSA